MNETTSKTPTRLPGIDALVAAHRANPGPIPKPWRDAEGNMLPETPEEARERIEATIRMLHEIAEYTDETDDPEILDEVDRDIDEGRQYRPLFGWCD